MLHKMIPRFKPYFGWDEFRAAWAWGRPAVEEFEQKFARALQSKYALAFPYGRSGLYALLKARGIEGAEVIMPAYTCVVVPNAVLASGNIPRFVDISLADYNLDLDLLENAITDKTRAIISTSLFGYPGNARRLSEMIKRTGREILVFQDCAHSFGAAFEGKPVANEGDAAIFGLGINKMITSILGGMVTTNDESIYQSLREYRESRFSPGGFRKRLTRLIYLSLAFIALNDSLYRLVDFLEEKTSWLDFFTSDYDENEITMPRDYLARMVDLEARVGIEQLNKYPEILRRKEEMARYYDRHLQPIRDKVVLPPLMAGATYSHYVVRVPDRIKTIEAMYRKGIQLGWLIEYSVPEIPVYRQYKTGSYPNAYLCSQNTINLPLYPGLKKRDLDYIIKTFTEFFVCNS
ncbi:MAG: DegT/DnrJ/EryC1/StrS family aminotransferase [Proteobacteria bacterium]|nr:DegT/DnrJ/EryC1/StrS family aminotransferase [Pseudomonadota bacterium]